MNDKELKQIIRCQQKLHARITQKWEFLTELGNKHNYITCNRLIKTKRLVILSFVFSFFLHDLLCHSTFWMESSLNLKILSYDCKLKVVSLQIENT